MDPQEQNEVFLRQHRVEKKGIENEHIRLRVETSRDKPEKRPDRVVHAATVDRSPSGMGHEKLAIGHMTGRHGYRWHSPLQVVLHGTRLLQVILHGTTSSGSVVHRGAQLYKSLALLRHVFQDRLASPLQTHCPKCSSQPFHAQIDFTPFAR